MPTIDASRLESTATRIFEALGTPAGDAAWIATLLVRANLRGHDSHGVIRIPQYAEAVRKRTVDPKSPISVAAETPVMARLDGGRGFGQVVARHGMEMAIAKAKASGLAAVGLSRTGHVGRLADYAEMAAGQGLVAMLWVNAVHGLNVAPWGGSGRRLGTNPHAIGIPGAAGPPPGVFANGTLMICLDVERFVPLADFHAQVAGLFGWVKSAKLAQGSKEILIPGEPEARLEAERRRDGVPVEDETWNQIERVVAELDIR